MNYRNLEISDYDGVVTLWRACSGVSLRDADSRAGIEKYLQRNPGLSFIAARSSCIPSLKVTMKTLELNLETIDPEASS